MPSELVKRMRAKYPTDYADLSDAELESKILAKYPEYKDLATQEPAAAPESRTSAVMRSMKSAVGEDVLPLAATAAGYATPFLKTAVEEIATNPNLPRMGAQAGRIIGGLAAPIGGAIESGPVGLLVGLAAASKSAWAGGKTGWFTTKLAQQIGIPVSRLLAAAEKAGPAVAAASAESAALSRMNSPKAFATLADALKPEDRKKFLAYIQGKE